MRAKTFLKKHPKLFLVFFNILILLGIFIIFEIALRIFTPDWLAYRMKYLDIGDSRGYGSDADWKVKYKDNKFYSFLPNSTFKIYHYEYENTVHINELGARYTSPGEKTDTSGLIPFTGDSFVIGVGVEDSENIVALSKKSTGYNFLNLGIGGTSMPIQRDIIHMRYDELGKPGLVVYGFFLGNDFDDIIKETEKKQPDSLVAQKNPEKTSESNPNGFLWKFNYFINHNNFFKRLYVLQFIKQKILNIKNKGHVKDMDPVFYIMNSKNEPYIERVKKEIDQEIGNLSKEPYQSIVILIPDRYQVNPVIRNNMCTYYNLKESDIDPLIPNKLLIAALDKYHIPYIDPTACISDHLKDGKLYYIQDNHFTKLGQQVISSCVKDSLQRMISQFKGK
jgi:hypothetical protein